MLTAAWARPPDVPVEAIWFAFDEPRVLRAGPGGEPPFTSLTFDGNGTTLHVDGVRRKGSPDEGVLWPETWLRVDLHHTEPDGVWASARQPVGEATASKALMIPTNSSAKLEGTTLRIGPMKAGRIRIRWTGASGIRERHPRVGPSMKTAFEDLAAELEPRADGSWDVRVYRVDLLPMRPVEPEPPPDMPAPEEVARELVERVGERITIHLFRKPPPTTLEELLGQTPLDPWSRPLVYEPGEGRSFRLGSYGADGRPGGEGPDADVFYDR